MEVADEGEGGRAWRKVLLVLGEEEEFDGEDEKTQEQGDVGDCLHGGDDNYGVGEEELWKLLTMYVKEREKDGDTFEWT